MKTHKLAALGCLLAGIAVAMGAFAAHALKVQLLPYHLSIIETGVQYQFWHALALVALAFWQRIISDKLLIAAGSFLVFGIFCFSGSLYALALTNWSWIWPITPIGGMSLVVGWVLACVSFWRYDN